MKTLVVDASVALKFFADEAGSDDARLLIEAEQPLVAPDWMLLEVASGLQKKVNEKSLSKAHAFAAVEALPEYLAAIYPAAEHLEQSFRLAFELGHPVYDCFYLELAVRLDAALVTADRSFASASKRAGFASRVRLLGRSS